MQTKLTILLLLCSIIIASALHSTEVNKKQTDLDKLTASLEGARAYIRPTSTILIRNNSNKLELPFYSRFILAPAATDIIGNADTVLTFYNKDTSVQVPQGQKLLWQHTDELYHYTLTSPR